MSTLLEDLTPFVSVEWDMANDYPGHRLNRAPLRYDTCAAVLGFVWALRR